MPGSTEGKQGQGSYGWDVAWGTGWTLNLEIGDRADVGRGEPRAPSGLCKKKDWRSSVKKLGFLTVRVETEASRCVLGCPPSVGVPTLREQEPSGQLGRQGLGRRPLHSPLVGLQSCLLTYTLSSTKTWNFSQAWVCRGFRTGPAPGLTLQGLFTWPPLPLGCRESEALLARLFCELEWGTLKRRLRGQQPARWRMWTERCWPPPLGKLCKQVSWGGPRERTRHSFLDIREAISESKPGHNAWPWTDPSNQPS